MNGVYQVSASQNCIVTGHIKSPGSASSAGAHYYYPQILAHNITADFTGTTHKQKTTEKNRIGCKEKPDTTPRNYIYIISIGLGSYASGSRLQLPLLE